MAMTQEEKMGLIPLKTKSQIVIEVNDLDDRLEAAIAALTKDKPGKIFATTKNGFVTLSGCVPNHKTKEEIGRAALGTPGVRCVTNHIKILLDKT